jgi:CRP/FNR family cyclic AMP-dependent transcriptional regulator
MFRDLPAVDIEEFSSKLSMRECSTGTVFFTPEDASERLFILKSGKVDLYHLNPEGKRLVLARIQPMTIFGEMGLLGQSLHGSFAESMSDCLICVATREEVLEVLRLHPEVALRLMEAVGTRLRVVEERLASIALSPVPVRLATVLLAQMTPDTHEVDGFTHAELGDMIGALRQTVGEALASMQRDGSIEVGHKWVKVIDADRLRGLTGTPV